MGNWCVGGDNLVDLFLRCIVSHWLYYHCYDGQQIKKSLYCEIHVYTLNAGRYSCSEMQLQHQQQVLRDYGKQILYSDFIVKIICYHCSGWWKYSRRNVLNFPIVLSSPVRWPEPGLLRQFSNNIVIHAICFQVFSVSQYVYHECMQCLAIINAMTPYYNPIMPHTHADQTHKLVFCLISRDL